MSDKTIREKKDQDKKSSDQRKNDKYNELEHKYKRSLADYQNLLKKTAIEKSDYIKYANEQLILEIIPIYENLKTSMNHVDLEIEKNGWAIGIKYIIKQFKDFLHGLGVEEIEAEGKDFDHSIMEVLEGNGNKVKKQIKAGYKLNGRLISPAKVILE